MLILINLFYYILISKIYGDYFFIVEIETMRNGEMLRNGNFFGMFYIHRPLNILMVSIFQFFTSDLFFIRFYGIIFSILAVIFLYKILCLKFSKRVAFFGSLLYSSIPILATQGPTLFSDNISLFFCFFGLYLYLKFIKSCHLKFIIFSAIIISVGFLIRETNIIMFAAIFFHLIWKKKYKEVLIFLIFFCLLPSIYSLWFIILKKPNPWINFYIYNVRNSQYIEESLTNRVVDTVIFSIVYGGIIGGLGILCFFQKIYSKNLKNDLDIIFFIYFIFSLIVFFTFTEVSGRYFNIFFPALIYFILASKLSKYLRKKYLYLIIVIVLINYIFATIFIIILLKNGKIEVQTVEWVKKNIVKNKSIYTNNPLIKYLLKHYSYNISEIPEEANYIIISFVNSEIEEIIKFDIKELKKFETNCTLVGIRKMNCNVYNINIYQNKKIF